MNSLRLFPILKILKNTVLRQQTEQLEGFCEVKICPQLRRPATEHRQGLGPPPSNGIAVKRTTYTQPVSN
jgi:hypothetical protein